MKNLIHLAGAIAFSAALVSCASMNHAIPARSIDGESPHVLPRGTASFHVGAGRISRDVSSGGNEERSIKLGSTIGLGHSHDLAGTVVFSQKLGEKSDEEEWPFSSFALRAKWNPEGLKRYYAMSIGAGVGLSDFLTSEIGLYSFEHTQIIGYENAYLTPYLNLKWQLNKIVGRPIDELKEIPETWGYEFIIGAKIPFLYSRSIPPFIKVEAGRTRLYGGGNRFTSYLYDVQFEVPFKY